MNIAGIAGDLPKRPGLPKEIDHIEITSDLMGKDPNSDDVTSTVAHELAHSVSVWHHGDVDGPEYWSRDANGNLTEQDVADDGSVFSFPKRTIYFMSEDSDPANLSNAATGGALDFLGLPRKIYVGNRLCGLITTVAVTMNGQHSGDVNSYMRYHNAFAYIPQGFPLVRLTAPGEGQLVGRDLTNQPIGTGINDPNRTITLFASATTVKRPRYGNAFDQRGNDFSQIDVNDNNTAIVRPVQQLCQGQ